MRVAIRIVLESFWVLSAMIARALLSAEPTWASCASETPLLISTSWLQKANMFLVFSFVNGRYEKKNCRCGLPWNVYPLKVEVSSEPQIGDSSFRLRSDLVPFVKRYWRVAKHSSLRPRAQHEQPVSLRCLKFYLKLILRDVTSSGLNVCFGSWKISSRTYWVALRRKPLHPNLSLSLNVWFDGELLCPTKNCSSELL